MALFASLKRDFGAKVACRMADNAQGRIGFHETRLRQKSATFENVRPVSLNPNDDQYYGRAAPGQRHFRHCACHNHQNDFHSSLVIGDTSDAASGPRGDMVQAWFMDDSGEDQRKPHQLQPNQPATEQELQQLGVYYCKLDADNYETDPELAKIRKENNYSWMDIITIHKDTLPNL
ncbi:unnamed protein product [Ranitomeya imitator]|uniref:acireductone dioxygenase (Fe(2+)-requiring) n=1 Tax=Ranitomeya imitator TaxID=111125 RepID=A0ABN9LJR9_9NEOB|nr:unnamed protein product [Ranitomeya imitator]